MMLPFVCVCPQNSIFSSEKKNIAYKQDITKISSLLKTTEHVDI